jgi:hypothetical protein
MLTWFRKNAAFLAGWLDWAAMYPLMRSPQGREQVVRFLYAEAQRKPNLVREMFGLYCRLASKNPDGDAILSIAEVNFAQDRPLRGVPDGDAPHVKTTAARDPLVRRGRDLYTESGERITYPVEMSESENPFVRRNGDQHLDRRGLPEETVRERTGPSAPASASSNARRVPKKT